MYLRVKIYNFCMNLSRDTNKLKFNYFVVDDSEQKTVLSFLLQRLADVATLYCKLLWLPLLTFDLYHVL